MMKLVAHDSLQNVYLIKNKELFYDHDYTVSVRLFIHGLVLYYIYRSLGDLHVPV